MSEDKDELAALKKKVEALESALSGKEDKPKPKKEFVPMTDAEHRDWVHQMSERRMNLASNFHPDDLRAMEAAAPTAMVKEIALRDARAPTGPSSAGASSQQRADVRETGGKSSTPGYVDPRPLSPPPGIDLIDRAVNAALPHGPEWGKGKR